MHPRPQQRPMTFSPTIPYRRSESTPQEEVVREYSGRRPSSVVSHTDQSPVRARSTISHTDQSPVRTPSVVSQTDQPSSPVRAGPLYPRRINLLTGAGAIHCIPDGPTSLTGAGAVDCIPHGSITGAGTIRCIPDGSTLLTGAGTIRCIPDGSTLLTGAGTVHCVLLTQTKTPDKGLRIRRESPRFQSNTRG